MYNANLNPRALGHGTMKSIKNDDKDCLHFILLLTDFIVQVNKDTKVDMSTVHLCQESGFCDLEFHHTIDCLQGGSSRQICYRLFSL